MGNYQVYEKYQDSGVEWLGEIPQHWQQKRMKFTVELINNKIDAENSDLPYMGLEQIESWTGKRIENENASSEGVGSHFLPNDVLFGKLRPYLAKVYLSELEGLASTEALVLRNREKLNANFLKYYILSRDFINIVNSSTFGSKMPRASWDFIGNLLLSIPPLDEQESIANFLDRKTKQIDDLIAKKEALLAKLDEKRSAIISHAVTKGPDPTVPMKDSGIDWFRNIPKHWKVSKAKFISRIFVPQRNKPNLTSDEGLPWLTMDDMSCETVTTTSLKVTYEAAQNAGSKILPRGSVVASCVGNFGVCSINEIDVIINQQLQAFIPSSTIRAEYLKEIVRLSKDYFQMIATSATVVYVNQSGFANMPIMLPPTYEQEKIIDILETLKQKIDLQKAKVQEAIERLKEYRTALITNAVTGKIDVRQVSLN